MRYGLLIVLTLAMVLVMESLAGQTSRNVLILNSYHQGFKWTDEQTAGILESCSQPGSGVRFYIEHMGSKWAYDDAYFAKLQELYRIKHGAIRFDVIVATDNDAYNFLVQRREQLYGAVPVVFCGVNWINPESIPAGKGFTGVNEDADIEANFNLMLRLHPKTSDIYVIVDATTTGRIVRSRIEGIAPRYAPHVTVHFLQNITMREIVSTVSGLTPGSLVFLTIFQKDAAGENFEFSDCRRIADASAVPVYGLWDFYLGYGIIGGMLTSGAAQGEAAGTLARRILLGEPAESIPVVMISPNRYRFDFRAMNRFGVPLRSLPPDSEVLNQPSPLYSFSKKTVWAAALFFAVLVVFIVVSYVNIHRRYEAERRYQLLVDNLTVGVYRTTPDPDGRFLQVNPAMVTMFGYASLEEFHAIKVRDIYPDQETRARILSELSADGSIRDRELVMRRKDGSPVWVSLSAALIRDERGRVVSIDGVAQDVTERHRLETELRHAQKMEAIGTLASGIAHDFNNALGGIVGVLSLMDRSLADDATLPPDKLRTYHGIMRQSAEKATVMVQRLLTLSRKREVTCSHVDLASLIDHVVALLNGVVDKSVTISFMRPDEPLVVLADAPALEQMFLNLGINAGHAMTLMRARRDDWGGTLQMTLGGLRPDRFFRKQHPEARAERYGMITVCDSGVGMTPEIIAKIFDPFFTTKGEQLGTGLGLSMVRTIVAEHEGFLDVYSEPGVGTTFKVYLPLSSGNPDEIAPSAGVHSCGQGMVLVVDDEPIMRETAAEILESCGFRVISAENGEEGIAVFRKHQEEIRVVLLDIAMPVMSGPSAFRELRAIAPALPVVVTSGFSQDRRIDDLKAMGADGFVEKPYTYDSLVGAITAAMRSGR
jgi:two-component system, cell cycle sensor histidine kinase and response regulator CckA